MNEASSVGQWVISAITVLSFIGLWMKLTRVEKREIGPQPFEVKQAEQFAPKQHLHVEYLTRAECMNQHARDAKTLETAVSEIKSMLEKHALQAEDRARSLHKRIDPISSEIVAAKGRLDDHLQDHRAGRMQHGP